MTTKHTPGPWQTDAGGEVHKDGRTIFAWPELSGAPDEEIHANMALGSAAPDLLAALKDWMRDGEGFSLTELRERYDENTVQRFLRSEAAIARAEHGDYT